MQHLNAQYIDACMIFFRHTFSSGAIWCLKCIKHVEDSIIHQVSLLVHFRLENHHKIVSMLDDQYYLIVMFVFSCHVAWSAFSSGSAAAGNGLCLHDVATLYQAAQWLKNKVLNGAFVAIEDITIIPSILGHSTPHSRVLQKTHSDISVQGVTKRLASASPCASTDPTMMSLIPKQWGVKCRMEFVLQKMFRI